MDARQAARASRATVERAARRDAKRWFWVMMRFLSELEEVSLSS
jgi:hypothetical protein